MREFLSAVYDYIGTVLILTALAAVLLSCVEDIVAAARKDKK